MVQHGISCISEIWNERYFSMNTSGPVFDLRTLGIDHPDRAGYLAISYWVFKSVMNYIEIEPGEDVFVDYGAGKGRAVVLACTYPFKRVIGVEISPQLATIAKENLRRAMKRLRCQQIEIVTADAREYSLPEDATILHFFNPFRGETLSKVVGEIKASLLRSPRKVTIIWANPPNFEEVLRDGNSIPNNWIRSRQDVLWPWYVEYYDPQGRYYRIYRIYPE